MTAWVPPLPPLQRTWPGQFRAESYCLALPSCPVPTQANHTYKLISKIKRKKNYSREAKIYLSKPAYLGEKLNVSSMISNKRVVPTFVHSGNVFKSSALKPI